MTESLEEALARYCASDGPAFYRSRRRVEGLVSDLRPGETRDALVLGAAARVGVVEQLRARALGDDELAERLSDRAGIRPDLASWAVRMWRSALGHSSGDAHRASSRPVHTEPSLPVVGHVGALVEWAVQSRADLPVIPRCLALSDDGQTAVWGASEGSVFWASVQTGWTIDHLAATRGPVTCVAVAPETEQVAFGGGRGQLKVRLEREAQVLKGHKAELTALAFSSDGTCLVSADAGGVLRFWQLRGPRRIVRVMEGHRGRVVGLQATGRWVVSAGEDGRVVWWDPVTAQPAATGRIDDGVPGALAASSARAWVGCSDTSLRVVERGQTAAQTQVSAELPVQRMSVDAAGELLAVSTWGPSIQLRDGQRGSLLAELAAHDGPVVDAQLVADGSRLVSVGSDRTLVVWAPAI